jgi:hypothetical protein
VRDLKQGTAAIEERARSELGMIKRDEVFYQILENSSAQMTAEAGDDIACFCCFRDSQIMRIQFWD